MNVVFIFPSTRCEMEVMSSNDEDEKMIDIFKRCLEDNNCLPLLKEEIKLKIQYRRIISGENELKVEQTKNVKYLVQFCFYIFLFILDEIAPVEFSQNRPLLNCKANFEIP